MYDCDSLLERLSLCLDGQLPESELVTLRQQAAESPGCETMFEAMLWVHQTLDAAPFAAVPRDFALSVTRELARIHRRDKILLAGILFAGAVIMLAPLLIVLWAGIAALLEPGLWQNAISWGVGFLSDIAAYAVAGMSLFEHMPRWPIVFVSAFISLSLLVLALAIVMQKAPEQLFIEAEFNGQRA